MVSLAFSSAADVIPIPPGARLPNSASQFTFAEYFALLASISRIKGWMIVWFSNSIPTTAIGGNNVVTNSVSGAQEFFQLTVLPPAQ
jgi:hypothetical protein